MMAAAIPRNTILIRSGSYFDFTNPAGSTFKLSDIAHGLSNVCRFAGQCPVFYSVAEHSVHVSYVVPPEDAWAGLMHDAAEAFIGDVAKPLKVLLPDYAEIEDRVERAIAQRFAVPHPLPPSIKLADRAMLAAEQRQLWNNRDRWAWTDRAEPADRHIIGAPPAQARRAFEDRARELIALLGIQLSPEVL